MIFCCYGKQTKLRQGHQCFYCDRDYNSGRANNADNQIISDNEELPAIDSDGNCANNRAGAYSRHP